MYEPSALRDVLTPLASDEIDSPGTDDDSPSSTVPTPQPGANTYSSSLSSITSVATDDVDDHMTVGYATGSAVMIDVFGDLKLMRASSRLVSLVKVTNIAKPDGYVAPVPSRSPVATTVPPGPTVVVTPAWAETALSIVAFANATSTVLHRRSVSFVSTRLVPMYAWMRRLRSPTRRLIRVL